MIWTVRYKTLGGVVLEQIEGGDAREAEQVGKAYCGGIAGARYIGVEAFIKADGSILREPLKAAVPPLPSLGEARRFK